MFETFFLEHQELLKTFANHSVIKVFVVMALTGLFIKYFKKPSIRGIALIGNKLVSNRYLNSFFYNESLVTIAFYAIPLLFINSLFDGTGDEFKTALNIMFLVNYGFVTIWLSQFLAHTVYYLNNSEKYKNKPLHSFAQIIFIVFLVVAVATIYAHFTNQSPKTLFTSLSVMSVAVFLTLKDIILGIVATLLIITNDIVNVGDWIKNEKYQADGNIIEINLITVKVLNFDKTVVVIPTYSLISEGFQNQQEIINSGKRRIKRCFRIDPQSVHFVSFDELENKYKKIYILKEYIEKRDLNAEETDNFILHGVNHKTFTNLGLFRKYVQKSLEKNPMIHNPIKNKKKQVSSHQQECVSEESEPNQNIFKFKKPEKSTRKEVNYNITVRIIEGEKEGIGFEIYCFSNSAQWQEYEHLVSTIMEQIYASGAYFGLKINN